MTDTTGTTVLGIDAPFGDEAEGQRTRLLAIRRAVAAERRTAISPAVDRALEQAEMYLFLGLGYVGHTDDLFPGETAG